MAAPMPRVWTPEQYDALPVDGVRRELVEGVPYGAPSPDEEHQTISAELCVRLRRLAPAQFRVTQAVEVRLTPQLRYIPDVLAVYADIPPGCRYEAHQVALVVEVESQNRSHDRVLKAAHYAKCGIPCYWRVEREPVLRLVTGQLSPDLGGYLIVDGFTDKVSLSEPWPIEFQLADLRI